MPNPHHRAITDVDGVLVGHASDPEAVTGCSVVLTPTGAVGGCDVRGGGPGTRETDLLNPIANVSEVHAIALAGGSAFGLAAATGVVEWLREQGYGYRTPVVPVPIVPASIIFDLNIGRSDRWADAAMGYAACHAANRDPVTYPIEGSIGVGMGATVGKLLGIQRATKSGVGTWSETLPDGTVVGALVVCNAFGDVYRDGRILAGVRATPETEGTEGVEPAAGGFLSTMHLLRQQSTLDFFAGWQQTKDPNQAAQSENTTLVVVATNTLLNKAQASKLAQMTQDALPRAIRPVHTPFDGDSVFTLATGTHTDPAPHLTILGSVAADVVEQAIYRAVIRADSRGGVPAVRDL